MRPPSPQPEGAGGSGAVRGARGDPTAAAAEAVARRRRSAARRRAAAVTVRAGGQLGRWRCSGRSGVPVARRPAAGARRRSGSWADSPRQ